MVYRRVGSGRDSRALTKLEAGATPRLMETGAELTAILDELDIALL
jgi:hypothetical protein